VFHYWYFLFSCFAGKYGLRERYLEQDRLGDEHIMREIEKFLREKGEVNDNSE
jgi:hypothetical protein